MKATYRNFLAGITLLLFFCNHAQAQFGIKATAAWVTDCNQSNYYNTSGNPADLIGPSGNVFNNTNFGAHTQNSGSLILRGAQVKTFKNPASSSACSARMFYRVYLQSGAPGAFTSINLPLLETCNGGSGTYPSGGTCVDGDQKWDRLNSNINLTTFAAGNYVLEVYYEASGSQSSTSLCNEIVTDNNGGGNYKAYFSIQSPNLSSTNPSSCFGNEGSITIGGLVPGFTYQLSYTDDGVNVGPLTLTANASGQLVLTGLNKGFYSNFVLVINGCTTNLFTGIILSDPIFVPTFTPIPPFCQGTPAPLLPSVSNNGMTGTWNPAVINNNATGTYTFTPDANTCGFPITITVTVIPRATPTFPFGTSLIICDNGTVPTLPNTSTNGFTGTWNPAVVDNHNSGVYTFTPNAGQCANPATFTVTVNPNITPTFSFGTTLIICAGGNVPTLPGTSQNGITGTWSPSVVDNQNSGTYTFTPGAGQCAVPTTFSVTVNPNVIPTFSFGDMTICSGGSVPTLPTTSDNGVTGTWSPSVVSNTSSGTYTFTPTAGLCALPFSFTVTVNPKITPTFSFGTSLIICAGGTVPVLPNTSLNGITGTWNPGVVDNQNSGTYTFTPDAGQCALPATFTVTVVPNITPTFSFGTTLTICAGGIVPTLVGTSQNGITGTWSPSAVDNQNSAVYTFTPSAGQCAVPVTFTVTVNPNVTPTFSFGDMTICSGGSVPGLPTTSDNGITGTWSPSVVSNTSTGTYTFTPTAGQCALPFSFTVTVNPNITPSFSFGTTLTICAGGTVPTLPGTSQNGITGTWNPAVVDDQNSGVYTFTPTAGQCALPATFTVTVNPNLTPTFSFGTTLSICTGGNVPILPTTSINGINGTWSPSVVDNQNSGTYTFTPTAGQCAVPTTFTVTVNPIVTPTFSFGTTLTICAGGSVPTLYTPSDNGITGTWSPSTVNNQNSGTYTFTPTAGQCAVPITFTVTVNPNITPTFSFGTTLTICAGGSVPVLPGTSQNGITGTWNPAVVDDQNSGTYTFTPTSGVCALPTTFNVTVNPNLTPAFSFGTTLTICAGGTVPTLPTTSTNGITGTWSPAVVDNQNPATYTFTPTAGQCVTGPVTFTVTVTPNLIPVFSFGNTLSICAGGIVPTLPGTSDNGINGTWNPAVVNNQTNGTYVFTAAGGGCVLPFTFTVTVNPILEPAFNFGTFQSVCVGSSVPTLPLTSTNGVTGTWNPAVIDNMVNGFYVFTPDAGQCADSASFILEVNIVPTSSVRADTTVYDGATVPEYNFISTPGSQVHWTNSDPSIGLTEPGIGTVPSFIAINRTNAPKTAVITATPNINGCSGLAQQYRITVLPLNKDVFVPNVFSPNGDGKNDILYVYGNYIDKLDMRIFNQWGQQIASITNKLQGWDGRHKGNAQPVGVYVYILKATLSDGRTVDLKGSITLVR
ncbi:MAG: gliding motility-associated C-terminal domain-containing protein [Bacteroidetes bacterium]|nr:MAG: gliding motility-associated C-terminal domain-containing protein [Bacteroidota bacterium]